MKKAPNIWKLEDLPGMRPVAKTKPAMTQVNLDGLWVPARPLGYYSVSNRFRLAWMVFTGKADTLLWPGGQ